MMIVIIARMQVDPLYLNDFRENINFLIKASQEEKGNISYSLYQDVNQANLFIMIEKWMGEEAIEAHKRTSHLTQFIDYTHNALLEPLHVEKFYAIGDF
ncbi:putative quinol monooxygenase [Gracilibacillus xinjiangensis]|uniref:Quinol monooxygenase n=1 Tax=Gracilibacillus xinjiangensis TaxID=1193282 RepID=A0ABV8WT83_9BACI